jgi:hypothetical protein
VGCVTTEVVEVSSAKALGQELFDAAADEIIRPITEQLEHARIRVPDRAEHVDDEHRIGCRVKRAASEMKRKFDRRTVSVGHAIHFRVAVSAASCDQRKRILSEIKFYHVYPDLT